MISWPYVTLQHIPEAEWGRIFLAYDNMCNRNKMNAATKHPLPLPPPYKQMWIKVRKVIDMFHLGNHKNHENHKNHKNHENHECKEMYNPSQIKEENSHLLTVNTQSAEITKAFRSP
ncbi:hypothetical protein BV898_17853 [Hypsibius exemplaris]|uniref:Uncharacterized protein n=1 Tax=Hypsibius exemplaris TaxID=2072580 RepID=A0A9X6NIN7_HYPEX|nr:hypothetical protein BV898_17853 [Hypsibius exemplaris]